ncbi:MAG: hypothetical protein A3A61_01850 [Candidatus Woykebacteria bacterium RIFCSPLOWO2_01_FULL_43_14]|uniref:Uncharacterized protein n=1 Tax=Candidatus Woykebacteria bacterium RIFCSPLOWO2_01_FULL_43_14 TaxID=1802605 RepID=A0A1G1WUX1_9BACT|nr:MAG: hypothetical protein A3A61_01850 [Candidatus Woykebacteria bacterium RIFCSPLOWO2_01_FULL_43_14]
MLLGVLRDTDRLVLEMVAEYLRVCDPQIARRKLFWLDLFDIERCPLLRTRLGFSTNVVQVEVKQGRGCRRLMFSVVLDKTRSIQITPIPWQRIDYPLIVYVTYLYISGAYRKK